MEFVNKTKIKTIYPLFFDSFSEAKNSEDKILPLCEKYKQVSLVIKEEGDMDDKDLLGLHPAVKIYAGVAWTKVHEMRKDEDLYES